MRMGPAEVNRWMPRAGDKIADGEKMRKVEEDLLTV